MAKKRNAFIDIAKVILAVMVVLAHTDFLLDINKNAWYLYKNGLVRVTVPVFLMINGYYFFNIKTKQQLIKWVKRVFILYIIWMFIYYRFWKHQKDISLIELFAFGWHHLWYITALFFAGTILHYLKKVSTNKLIFIIISLFLAGIAIQYTKSYSNFNNDTLNQIFKKPYVVRNFLLFGLPFMATGFLIKKEAFKLKGKAKALTILGFVLLLIECYINYKLTNGTKGFDLLLSQVLLCPSLFILILQIKFNSNLNSKTISLYSSAIYFSHSIPWFYIMIYWNLSNTLTCILTLLFTVIISFLLIQLNKKIKYLL